MRHTSRCCLRLKRQHDVPGAFHLKSQNTVQTTGATSLFLIGKGVIGLYLGHGSVASSYGVAGSVIALILWIYYSAQIFFFGAAFTRQYADTFGKGKRSIAQALDEIPR